MKRLILFCCIFSIVSACTVLKPQTLSDDRLHVINYTDKKIYAIFSTNAPDTSIVINNDEIITFPVSQGNNQYYPRCITLSKKDSWQYLITEKGNDFPIHIFIFDANVIENVGWNEIVKKQLILKRIDITFAELINKKWDVIYQN